MSKTVPFNQAVYKGLCLYIHGEPGAFADCCGAERKPGSRFCADHHRQTFRAVDPKKEQRWAYHVE